MLVETKARVGVFAIALGAYLPQFPTLVPEFEVSMPLSKRPFPIPLRSLTAALLPPKSSPWQRAISSVPQTLTWLFCSC